MYCSIAGCLAGERGRKESTQHTQRTTHNAQRTTHSSHRPHSMAELHAWQRSTRSTRVAWCVCVGGGIDAYAHRTNQIVESSAHHVAGAGHGWHVQEDARVANALRLDLCINAFKVVCNVIACPLVCKLCIRPRPLFKLTVNRLHSNVYIRTYLFAKQRQSQLNG